MTPRKLHRCVLKLSAAAPITEAFEARLAKTTTSLRHAWYENQREHWLGWLKEYNGPGYYGRATWEVDARVVYNRVGNPAMVLWLGEASGVPTERVKAAAAAANLFVGSFPRQCRVIRTRIPWDVIEVQLSNI